MIRHSAAWLFIILCASSLTFAGGRVAAQESSDAAKIAFKAAADFQNDELYDFAVDAYRDFLSRFPDDPLAPKARHYLGVCLIQEKKHAEAEKELQQVLDKHPKFELLDETLLNLGTAQYSQALASGKQEDFKAPAETFGKLIEDHPQSKNLPPALFNRAEALYAIGEKEAALAAYSKLLDDYASHSLAAKALYGKGVALQELDKNAEAQAAFDAYLSSHPDDQLATEIKMRKADTLFAAGEYAAAEKLFAETAGVAGFPFADRSLLRQAESAYMQKEFAKAGKLYAEVVEKYPDSANVPTARLAAGSCFYLVKDYDNARKWYTAALPQGGEVATEAAHWIARSHLDQGQAAEALAAAEKQLPQAEGHKYFVDLLMDQADALYELPDRRAESIAKYAAIADAHADHESAATARYMAAFASLNEGKYDDALAQADQFLAAHADHKLTPDVKFVAAESHLLLDHFAESEKLYDELLSAHPDHRDAETWLVRKGLTLRRQEKFADSIAALEPVIAKLTTPAAKAEANFLLGASYFTEKDYAKSEAALAASLAADSNWRQSDEATLLLARAQRQQQTLDKASATIQQMLATYPDSKALDRATYYQGEFQFAAEDYPAAVKTYEKLLSTWPQSEMVPAALYDLGWSRLNQQDYDGADQTFSRLVSEHPGHRLAAATRFARAEARRQNGDVDGAVTDVQEFLKSNPEAKDRAGALYILGVSQVKQKKYDEAIANLSKILEEIPEYGNLEKVRYELAWAYKEQGKEDEAAPIFTALATEHPDSPFAAEALYHVGDHQYRNKEFGEAAKSYYAAQDKARQAKQNDIAEKAAHKLAWAYYQQEDYEKAAGGFEFQVANYADGQLANDGRFMKGESLYRQQKYAEALQTFNQVRQAMPASEDFQVLVLLHGGQSASQLALAAEDETAKSGLWETSLTYYDEALESFPESAYKFDLMFEKARALHETRKLDEALPLYNEVADGTLREVGARARLMAGEIKFEQKDYSGAVRDFFKVFRGYSNAPDSFNPWKAQAAYETGRVFEAMQRPEKAVEYYEETIRDYPNEQMAELAKRRLAALKKD
ncbi:MAG: tetratricopeptide repeat protein [Pirellulales bacterium]